MKVNNYKDYFKAYRDRPMRWNFWIRVISSYKPKGNLLEIGCAEGNFLKRARKIYNSYGIDNYQKFVKKAKDNGVKQVYKSDGSDLRMFSSNYFDIIALFDVLEHMKNPRKCIKECSRVIKKGGILVISVPNTSSVLRTLKKSKWFAYGDKTHKSILSKKEWLDLLNDFKILKIASDGFWDLPYFSFLPLIIQKVFLLPGYLQYKLNRLIIPPIGENLIIISEKK